MGIWQIVFILWFLLTSLLAAFNHGNAVFGYIDARKGIAVKLFILFIVYMGGFFK